MNRGSTYEGRGAASGRVRGVSRCRVCAGRHLPDRVVGAARVPASCDPDRRRAHGSRSTPVRREQDAAGLCDHGAGHGCVVRCARGHAWRNAGRPGGAVAGIGHGLRAAGHVGRLRIHARRAPELVRQTAARRGSRSCRERHFHTAAVSRARSHRLHSGDADRPGDRSADSVAYVRLRAHRRPTPPRVIQCCPVRARRKGACRMTLAIALAEATDEREVGGKARNLARLIALGVPVPAGMVLTRTAFDAFADDNGLTDRLERLTRALDPSAPERLRRTAEAIRTLVMTATLPASIQRELHTIAERLPVEPVVAVRSSAIGEDGAHASFAGQFDSMLGVRSEAELRHALLACWASCWSGRALFYRLARRLPFNGMGVIVERQVAARISGVLFTRAPDGLVQAAAPDDLVIEYSAGLGDALMSGRIDPHRLVVSRATLTVQNATTPDAESVGDERDTFFALEQVLELSRLSLRLETELGAPQDIEWAIDEDGVTWILQARPITTPAGGGGDPKRAPDVVWSNANVNENFPQPISPLLYSIAEAGYYHYFRNLG